MAGVRVVREAICHQQWDPFVTRDSCQTDTFFSKQVKASWSGLQAMLGRTPRLWLFLSPKFSEQLRPEEQLTGSFPLSPVATPAKRARR